MTYNRAEIMRDAWAQYRGLGVDRLAAMGVRGRRIRFANCLRQAWDRAKAKVRAQRQESPVETLRLRILHLECKSRLFPADFAELARMNAELRQMQAAA